MVLENDDAWRHSALARGLRGRFPPEPFRYVGSRVVKAALVRKGGGPKTRAKRRRASIPCWPGWRLAGWCRWPGRRKHSGVWLDCVFLTYKIA